MDLLLSIPGPSLIGLTFYAQGVYTSLPSGSAWSNGIELHVNPGEFSLRAFEH